MSYIKSLEKIRKTLGEEEVVETPVVKTNFINRDKSKQNAAQEASNASDPLALSKGWIKTIRSSGETFRKKMGETPLPTTSSGLASFTEGAKQSTAAVEAKKAEAEQKRRSMFDGLEGDEFKLNTGGSGDKSAYAIIREAEGFREKPYWDVNAYRVGYGSDTITKPDGSVVKVTPDVRVTKDDAERDLARRGAETRSGIVNKIGDRVWFSLPDPAKEALTSIAYNYGKLPDTVVARAKTGDLEATARAVEKLKGHNDGINAARRQREADMIRGLI